MSKTFLDNLKANTNKGLTENLAVKYNSTLDPVLDMFAFGGAYRNRTDDDVITLFKNAFKVDETLALRCLFYLRDISGGKLFA